MRATFPLLGLTVLLSACGGGGGGGDAGLPIVVPAIETPGTPPAAAGGVGVYDISYGTFKGVYTFLDNGDFYGLHYYADQSGVHALGHPYAHLSPSNDLTHTTALVWGNFFADDQGVGLIDRQGALGREFRPEGLFVELHSNAVGNESGFAATQKPWAPGSSRSIYLDPIPLSQLAGTYRGYWRSAGLSQPRRDLETFTLGTDGKLRATSVGCTVQGNMRQHGQTGVFDTELQAAGGPCGAGLALTGIVTPVGYAQGKATLAFQVHAEQVVLVFIVEQQ